MFWPDLQMYKKNLLSRLAAANMCCGRILDMLLQKSQK